MKNIKINNLLIGMLAMVLFFACTQSNVPNNEPGGEITFEIIDQELEAAYGQCKLAWRGVAVTWRSGSMGPLFMSMAPRSMITGMPMLKMGFAKLFAMPKFLGRLKMAGSS